MTTDELDQAWQAVDVPSTAGALAGRLAPDLHPKLGLTIAVDRGALRHVLIPVDEQLELPALPTTKGLEVTVDELKVGTSPARHYLDVACKDATMHRNFTMVAAELLSAMAVDPSDPAREVARILKRWRWFWGAPLGGLDEESVLGLFGELWFLEFWLGPITEETLSAWRGAPYADRHDFKWSAASVEVKATRTRSDGAAEHRIGALDQLESPEQGPLHLFSLRMTSDPIGAHSLIASIDRIRLGLDQSPDTLRSFDDLLGRAGYSPADRDRYAAPLRVVAEELYKVGAGFPRLTKDSFLGGIPGGVGKIAYSLDLAACQPWLIAKSPSDEPANELRATLRSS